MNRPNNLFHTPPPGPKPPHEVYCLVEIPRGESNKYEYDKDLGVFKLDRVLYGAVFYPTEYGFIPQTWSRDDNDPLDIMLLSTFPTFPGCLLRARPIGLLRLMDSGKKDDKIIAVAADDPRLKKINGLADLDPHFQKEVENFWQNYAELRPGKKIEVLGWDGVKEAHQTIKEAIGEYQKKFPSEVDI